MRYNNFSTNEQSLDGKASIRVQAVIYNLHVDNVNRTLEFLDSAALYARQMGAVSDVSVIYGDSSPQVTLTDTQLSDARRRFKHLSSVEYSFFSDNLGSAGGHNRIFDVTAADFTFLINPDVLLAPNALYELIIQFRRPDIGMVEARQLPIEHPKMFNAGTGETSWGSGACTILPSKLFKEVDGYDAETFFLYCDDVDLSWRIRLLGLSVVHQPSAVVYHDKRLLKDGRWDAGEAERYYSAEAALLLTYKYSRPDLTLKYLEYFENSSEVYFQKAAKEFHDRKAAGRLPLQLDKAHQVAEFIDGNYAEHRFSAI